MRRLCGRVPPWRRERLRDRERGTSRDMDLIAIAFIAVLAAIGLAWIVFAERI